MRTLLFSGLLGILGCTYAPGTSIDIIIEKADANNLTNMAWRPFATLATPDTRPALDRVVLASTLVAAALAPLGHHNCQIENAQILVPWTEVPHAETQLEKRVPLQARVEVAEIPKDPPLIPQDAGWDRTLLLGLRCEPGGALTARVEFGGS